MCELLVKLVKKKRHRIANGIIFALLFSILPLLVEYTYLSLMPRNNWFVYEEIAPLTELVEVGTTPRFVSTGEIKKPGKYTWLDVMKCEDKTGEYFYRSYESSAFVKNPRKFPEITIDPKTGDTITTSWEYGYTAPKDKGEKCHLESTIAINLKFGIQKTQQLKSKPFLTN